MADLLTHLSLGAIWKSATRGGYPEVFVVGCALPDLAGRVPGMGFSWLLEQGLPVPEELLYGFTIFHMPAGFVPLSFLLAMLFAESERPAVWGALVGGCLFHLAIDMLQIHYGAGYMLLYPFSTWDWEAGLMGSESTVWMAPLLAGLALWSWRRRIRVSLD